MYLFAPLLLLVVAFQNCIKNNIKNKSITSIDPAISSTTSTSSTGGDHAVFKLSEKYGGEVVSNISWQIQSTNGCGEVGSIEAVKTGLSIEIPWNNDPANDGPAMTWGGFNIRSLIHLEQEECFIYRDLTFRHVFDHLTCLPPFGRISFSPSNDPSIERIVFPIGSSVNLEFKKDEGIEESLENMSFQWSIKKNGDKTELADQSHTSPQLTHTFLEMGLYTISIKIISIKENPSVFRPASSNSVKKELFIGLCEKEKEVEAVEIILSQESFGNLTPKNVLEKQGPIFNYVRPSDTDPNNKVTIFYDVEYGHPIYKYKRNSPSQFIDIDIQNADGCFFDDEPVQKEMMRTRTYEIRENLPPLPCSGNISDSQTVDTDITGCTDDVFIIAASRTQRTFYKHCPLDEDYCYLSDYKYLECPIMVSNKKSF